MRDCMGCMGCMSVLFAMPSICLVWSAHLPICSSFFFFPFIDSCTLACLTSMLCPKGSTPPFPASQDQDYLPCTLAHPTGVVWSSVLCQPTCLSIRILLLISRTITARHPLRLSDFQCQRCLPPTPACCWQVLVLAIADFLKRNNTVPPLAPHILLVFVTRESNTDGPCCLHL